LIFLKYLLTKKMRYREVFPKIKNFFRSSQTRFSA
jgi:hypothetical protein